MPSTSKKNRRDTGRCPMQRTTYLTCCAPLFCHVLLGSSAVVFTPYIHMLLRLAAAIACYWARQRQQQWLGARTARSILMQDAYTTAPARPNLNPSPNPKPPFPATPTGGACTSMARTGKAGGEGAGVAEGVGQPGCVLNQGVLQASSFDLEGVDDASSSGGRGIVCPPPVRPSLPTPSSTPSPSPSGKIIPSNTEEEHSERAGEAAMVSDPDPNLNPPPQAVRVSPPPPPPLPPPTEGGMLGLHGAPLSPFVSSGNRPVLGQVLLDFLLLFGEDFEAGKEGFSVRGGGFRFNCHGIPPHPQASDPIVIEDPLNCINNVGRSSFFIGKVQRVFFEVLTKLKATMVRVNHDGKEVLASGSSKPQQINTGILKHIIRLPETECPAEPEAPGMSASPSWSSSWNVAASS
ncbi:unnamed protein product [Discosporangium mesarthrocarpum]